MLLPEHKFLVQEVFAPENTPNGKHRFQRIILNKPGYTDEFGEKRGKDDLYECTVWNKKIDELPALKSGDKVKTMLNMQGVENIDQNGKKLYYTQITIRKIELL